MSQLFGDRALIANATGCSSIYGGNLPTTPWTTNHDGRGPAWSNSLFEDNAEFGLGMRLALDKQAEYAAELVRRLSVRVGDELTSGLLEADQSTEAGIDEQRQRVRRLRERLRDVDSAEARDLAALADMLVKKSVWIVGGDGWAYDIGFGGLDHVLASGRNVNLLVLDTEVYSNTGGQMSKSTPRGAVAKFAAAGKRDAKKDLALIAMQLRRRLRGPRGDGRQRRPHAQRLPRGGGLRRAVADPGVQPLRGPRLRHGPRHGAAETRRPDGILAAAALQPGAAAGGQEPLDPRLQGAALPLKQYVYNESRYTMLVQSHPEEARDLLRLAEQDVRDRWNLYEKLAAAASRGSRPETGLPEKAEGRAVR